MKNNKSTWVWVIVVVVLLLGLFLYPRLTTPKNNVTEAKGVPCLVPNIPLSQHIHPEITILVDGVKEYIAKDMGLAGCERAIHTHEEDGVIHVEAQDKREYVLGDFFWVWNEPIERDGYSVSVTADGASVADPYNLKLLDKQKIVLTYTKLADGQ